MLTLEIGEKNAEHRMRIVLAPDQRVWVDGRWAAERNASQVVTGGPEVSISLADKCCQLGRFGDCVEECLGSEVWADRINRETECGRELVVVLGPLGAWDDAGNPDPVIGELSRGHGR